MVSQPLAKNKILIRLENIADLFDSESTPAKVNLDFVKALYKEANSKALDDSSMKVQIKEMSLTSNMEIEEMLSRKIQWKTRDDPNGQPATMKQDFSIDELNQIKLIPQRIRVFEATLVQKSKESEESFLFLQK
jgi:hypothetical protein